MQSSKVKSDPAILAGKPVLAGTRISVELKLERQAAGESERQILEAHPRVEADAVRVALAFAASALRTDVIYRNDAARAVKLTVCGFRRCRVPLSSDRQRPSSDLDFQRSGRLYSSASVRSTMPSSHVRRSLLVTANKSI